MKTYTLERSATIQKITTDRENGKSYMRIYYKDATAKNTEPKEYAFLDEASNFFKSFYSNPTIKNRLVIEHDIGYVVLDLLKKGLIDYELATDIRIDFSHLFAGISFIEYKNTKKSDADELKATYLQNRTNENQYSSQQSLLFKQESSSESSETLHFTKEEQKMINESIANTPLQAAQSAVINSTNANLFAAGKQHSKKTEMQTPSYSCSHFSKVGLGTEVQINNVHTIANVTCEFKLDNTLGLLLLISSDKTSQQTVPVSDINKRDIFECHQLSELIDVLKPINNTASIVKTLEILDKKQTKLGFNI